MVPCPLDARPPPTDLGPRAWPAATAGRAVPGTCPPWTRSSPRTAARSSTGTPALSAARPDELVAAVAGGLTGARRPPAADAVAWQVPNSLAAAVLPRACWRIGAVAAPVLHSFGAADVEAALGQIDPALVLELAPDTISDPVALVGAVWRRARRRRDLSRPILRRRPGPVHLRLDGDTQGGAAHATRPELEGRADGPGARPRVRGCGAHAGADGPHLGPAQRRARAGRGGDALGPRPPLRPRAGPRPGGARADLVPRRSADLLHRHGTCAGARARPSTCRRSGSSRAAAPPSRRPSSTTPRARSTAG